MDIQVFHAYNNLVDQGFAEPLRCPDCSKRYVLRVTEDNEPYFACMWCDTVAHPGIRMYNDVLEAVKEHSE